MKHAFHISRAYWFSAAHRIENHPKCGRLHGHNYKVVVTLGGDTLPSDGMLLDFGAVDKIVKPIIDGLLDHRYLVSASNVAAHDPYLKASEESPDHEADICMLHTPTSTAEDIAYRLCAMITAAIVALNHKPYIVVERVAVWETHRSEAVYEP